MLPKPNENETDADFITRAMQDEEMVAKYTLALDRSIACQKILKEQTLLESLAEDGARAFEAIYEKAKSEVEAEIERRTILADDLEMRVEGEGEATKLTGYAATFNKWSETLGWFREKIDPGAFADALKNSDVRALKNHDPNLLLGRSTSGTLRLDENKTGLKFEIDIPDTNTGRDTAEEVRRGAITGCSFAFTVEEDSWKYDEKNGLDERTIVKVGQLFDVGPVTYPAYPDTSVAARDADTAVARRSRDAFMEAHKKPDEHKEQRQEGNEPEPKEEKSEPLDFETRHRIKCGYREAARIIERNKSADA